MVPTMDRWTGAQIAEARKAAGLRQADVAARLGVSAHRIRNVEEQARVANDFRDRVLLAIVALVAERGA